MNTTACLKKNSPKAETVIQNGFFLQPRLGAPMSLRTFAVMALASSVVALGGCRAIHRDVSAETPYKEHIGQICKIIVPLRAHGYTFTVERNKKTDAISIWNPGFTGPEVTFILLLQPGTQLTLLEARECVNCPFDLYPEYHVRISPEPPQFGGRPAYLRSTSLNEGLLHCIGGTNSAQRIRLDRSSEAKPRSNPLVGQDRPLSAGRAS